MLDWWDGDFCFAQGQAHCNSFGGKICRGCTHAELHSNFGPSAVYLDRAFMTKSCAICLVVLFENEAIMRTNDI